MVLLKIILFLKGILLDVFNLLFPRYCLICGTRLAASEEELCNCCVMARPFQPIYGDNRENVMVRSLMGVMPIEKAQSMMHFYPESNLANVIYGMKYRNQPEVGFVLGRMCAKILLPTGFFDDIDLIVPVPLSKSRKKKRGYNQSEYVAMGISKATGIKLSSHCLVREGFIKSQTHLSEWERQENVEGCFSVVDAAEIEGKHVLLIDDILTTGATVKSCGMEMTKRVENLRISVLTIGHTSS